MRLRCSPRGEKEAARAAAANATLRSTGLVPALELYAKLSDELGYVDDAIGALTRLLALEEAGSEGRRVAETQLADLYLRLHRYEEAEQLMESALAQQPHHRPTRFKAAVVLGACTKLGRALELLESLLADRPDDGAVMEKKAWVLWLMHRNEEAATAARHALEVMPDSEICLRRLVEYETLAGNPRRAEHYRRQLESLDNA